MFYGQIIFIETFTRSHERSQNETKTNEKAEFMDYK